MRFAVTILAVAMAVVTAAPMLPATSRAEARDNVLGLGFILGEPTGLSAKFSLDDRTALAAAAWSFVDERGFHVHADYLLYDYDVFPDTQGSLPLYYGIGGRFKAGDETRLGLRGVVGINYLFARHPLDAFMEFVPLIDLAPRTEFGLNAAIGIRMFFRWSPPGPARKH